MAHFVVPSEKAEEVRQWHTSGRGIYMWTSKDLSTPRPDMITPGDVVQAPHWAYVGQPIKLDPSEIIVVTETKIEVNPEWFPKCSICGGCGNRTVDEVLIIRNQPVNADTRNALIDELSKDGRTQWDHRHMGIFKCWSCKGSRHDVQLPTARVKRAFWGQLRVSNTGITKFNALAKKLEAFHGISDVKWRIDMVDTDLCQPFFYTEKSEPLFS